MKAVETMELTRRFKNKTVVNALNLEIYKGELFALLGVNGAGKTTTIKMLTCLLRPTSGDAQLHGHSITGSAAHVKEIINISPQETAVAQNLTVKENLELISGIYGSDKATARNKAKQMIQRFRLEQDTNTRAKKLSGGMQRRLSIAMALISEPRILFLDEPTLGLDVLSRRELWAMIAQLKGEVTIILTTHYMEEAEALSDRIGIMQEGCLQAVGTPEDFIQQTGAKNFEEAFVALASNMEVAL